MKKKYNILLLFFMLSNLQSCNFLEVDKIGKADIDTFFSDLDGLRATIPGVYRLLYNFYDSEFLKYPEVAADIVWLSSIADEGDMLDQYNYTSTSDQESGAVGYIWRKGFEVIGNANNIIKYAPELKDLYPNNVDEIDNIIAQAMYIRALTHLNISLCYAQHYTYTSDASHLGVPNVARLPSANEGIARVSMNEVYNERIIPDLKQAIELFGEDEELDVFYSSKLACQALLSRVYLYMEAWSEAKNYASLVIEKISLTPYEDYTDMFNNIEAGKEAIFRLSGYRASESMSKFYHPQEDGVARPTDKVYSLFENDKDVRLQLLKYDNPNSGGVENACMKFFVTKDVSEDDKHYDPFVSRVSEMYLIRAEASCHLGELSVAEGDIKTLQARAMNVLPSSVTLTYSGSSELLEIVDKERIKELCFEGHRLFDITRKKQDMVRDSNTNSIVKEKRYPNDWFVLPISIRELEVNPSMQPNPGVN